MKLGFLPLVLFLAGVGLAQEAPAPKKPLDQETLQVLVTAGVDSDRLARQVGERGITFEPTDEYLETLRVAGATEALLNALRAKMPGGAPATAPPAELVLQMSATERVWVAVDADGKPVLERALNAREVQTVKATEFFDVTTDNAHGLNLVLDGEPLGPLGRGGEVRSFRLTREDVKSLRAGKQVQALTPAPAPEPVRVGGKVEPPKLISQTKPAYPPMARAARIYGKVRIEATIGKDGKVRDTRVIAGDPVLVQAVREAVRRWRYQPALLNGVPVEGSTEIEVDFPSPK